MKKWFCCLAMLATLFAAAQLPGDEERELFQQGRQRDSLAVDEAVRTWWTASMRNHAERIAWWQEARFGMFIHWGVYSLPGGEWKGKKVGGYAEHLMRKEKISRAEYLGLASQFNPNGFNAEEWVRHAKEAGMRYLIITAKHHDGFALYPSSVSDFNIAKKTPFRRDPMAELAAACRKHGLKFGFYYSHAFDWEHPDAPGNDWEYENPGGDRNLHGGRGWYDLHPELLVKARKYVDEKAMPQLRELIRMYQPDILWFDTPHKLPLSENVRILQSIRAIDSTVVVNGRLVRSAAANFGDYRNTADRPAEFFPVDGDWEAIPTTNESYGYSKFDSTHKPAAHFIRLLASAASRGGNLLMNIGPKGDGTFDEKDVSILKGIGSWMSRNGESIYGTTAGPLPLQSWGVSTAKGNKLYLHVFRWPKDGKLYLGGLNAKVRKASLLTSRARIYISRNLSEQDILLEIGSKPVDTVNTVFVLELEKPAAREAGMFVSRNIPETRLLAFDARQQGKGFSFGDGKTDRYYVEGWHSKEQFLEWPFRVHEAGDFRIRIKYLAPSATSGGIYSLSVGQYHEQHQVQTSESSKVITQELGTYPLARGAHLLKIAPVALPNQELMKLLELQLVPVLQKNLNYDEAMKHALEQTKLMEQEIPRAQAGRSGATQGITPGSAAGDLVSPRTLDSGQLRMVTSRDWTSGFFPGVVWMLHEFTGEEQWKKAAQQHTGQIEREKTNAGTHDMGFKIYCSFGNGFRLTGDPHYRDVMIESARTLSTRFNKVAGVIRSWDNRARWRYPVIIDNMMNLELLFAATRLTGDSSFYQIAATHATTTMNNHFRADNSSFHVLDYDTLTGKIVQKTTHQGFSDASAWARGQAWGLYGFTMCYRETKNRSFLGQAEKIADYVLNHPTLPADGVPYWDFDAPAIPAEPRDASAAAIIASALYELSLYSAKGKEYRKQADRIVENLFKYYLSPVGESKGFILLHSTGAKPSNSEVDVPLIYADYYYLEALMRQQKIKKGKSLF